MSRASSGMDRGFDDLNAAFRKEAANAPELATDILELAAESLVSDAAIEAPKKPAFSLRSTSSRCRSNREAIVGEHQLRGGGPRQPPDQGRLVPERAAGQRAGSHQGRGRRRLPSTGGHRVSSIPRATSDIGTIALLRRRAARRRDPPAVRTRMGAVDEPEVPRGGSAAQSTRVVRDVRASG